MPRSTRVVPPSRASPSEARGGTPPPDATRSPGPSRSGAPALSARGARRGRAPTARPGEAGTARTPGPCVCASRLLGARRGSDATRGRAWGTMVPWLLHRATGVRTPRDDPRVRATMLDPLRPGAPLRRGAGACPAALMPRAGSPREMRSRHRRSARPLRAARPRPAVPSPRIAVPARRARVRRPGRASRRIGIRGSAGTRRVSRGARRGAAMDAPSWSAAWRSRRASCR